MREELERQAAEIAELRKLITDQAKVIDELRAGAPAPPRREVEPATGPAGQPPSPVTDRRGLLRQAGAAAAGAVAGAVVLGQASPAAAATADTGNPAILGTAVPATGVGVKGVASGAGGKGVLGETNDGTGVHGKASGTGTGVVGEALAEDAYGVHGIALEQGAHAIHGEAVNGYGVYGGAIGGHGVVGETDNGNAVMGLATNGYGVMGSTNGSTAGVLGLANSNPDGKAVSGLNYVDEGLAVGVYGESAYSPTGIGVHAFGRGAAISAGSPRAQLHLDNGGSEPPTPPLDSSATRVVGEMVFDTNEDLWVCVVGGTPGTWRKIAGPSTSGAFHALAAPVRVYDSRPGTSPATGPKTPLAAATPRTLDLKNNSSGIPAGAVAVLLSLVATGTKTGVGGYMTVYTNGIAWPGTSNLNWSGAGETVAVTTITAVDSDALCRVYAGSITDVVVDVLGYYL